MGIAKIEMSFCVFGVEFNRIAVCMNRIGAITSHHRNIAQPVVRFSAIRLASNGRFKSCGRRFSIPDQLKCHAKVDMRFNIIRISGNCRCQMLNQLIVLATHSTDQAEVCIYNRSSLVAIDQLAIHDRRTLVITFFQKCVCNLNLLLRRHGTHSFQGILARNVDLFCQTALRQLLAFKLQRSEYAIPGMVHAS